MKYLDYQAMLACVTQWVRDGSTIKEIWSAPHGSGVDLQGKDGAIEHFAFYFEREDYDHDHFNMPGNGQP